MVRVAKPALVAEHYALDVKPYGLKRGNVRKRRVNCAGAKNGGAE